MSLNQILELIISIFDLTIDDFLREMYPGQPWVEPVIDVLGILIMSTILLLSIFFIGWVERKVLGTDARPDWS